MLPSPGSLVVEENCEISVEHASDIDSMQIGLRAHWIRREISVCLNHHMERYVRPQDLVDRLARVFGRLSDDLRAAGLTPQEADRASGSAEPRLLNEFNHWRSERTRRLEDPRAQGPASTCTGSDRSGRADHRARAIREQAYFEETRGKSKALLLRMLTPEQRAQFERENRFTVRVKGRGRFLVTSATIYNVVGPDFTTYCAQAEPPVPIYMRHPTSAVPRS